MEQTSEDLYKSIKKTWIAVAGGLQIASALITIFTVSAFSFIGTFFAHIFHQQGWIAPLIAFSIGGLAAVGSMLTFSGVRTAKLQRKLPPRWILRSYKYVNTESFYEIDEKDSRHHTFRITTTIRALQSGVNIFENTYRWTGQGKEETPKVISPGHVLLGETVSDSGWKYYYIHLGQPLNKGDETKIETVQELSDTEHKFDPYLAKIISQPVDRLTLHIKLPNHPLPSLITFSIWNTEGPASNPIKTQLGKIDHQTGDIIWSVEKPILGYRYEIRWKYSNANPITI